MTRCWSPKSSSSGEVEGRRYPGYPPLTHWSSVSALPFFGLKFSRLILANVLVVVVVVVVEVLVVLFLVAVVVCGDADVAVVGPARCLPRRCRRSRGSPVS